MVAVNLLPNERSKVRALAGTEASRGAGGTPTFQLMGDFRVTETEPLIEREEYTGTLDPWVTPELGPYDVNGTYAELLTYESLATHLRYGMNGDGAVPVTDGNATPGYTNTYDPCAALTDIDSMVVEHGPPGLPELAKGVMHKQWTIAADTDDAEGSWKWDSTTFLTTNAPKAGTVTGVQTATGGSTTTVIKAAAGWTVDGLIGAYVFIRSGPAIGDARKVIDNDATTLTVDPPFSAAVANTNTFEISAQFTAGIAVPAYEKIKAAGTKVFIDNAGGTIGTTQLLDKAISWSVTHALDMNPKRFLEYERGYSAKIGEGWRRVTGQVRIEFDDLAEYNQYKNKASRLLRFQREGSTIDSGASTKKLARIDVYAGYWNEVTRDQDRNSNLTRVFQFKGYLDASAAKVMRVVVKHKLVALP
jgi:hypothetical protein